MNAALIYIDKVNNWPVTLAVCEHYQKKKKISQVNSIVA